MWLEEVVLDGFKSYAQATKIRPFDRSFTAITGLNGSGKSNVLDAICFVLGITQLSRIRVNSLSDLIYKQGQAGVTKASVSLVFNNDETQKSPQGYESYKQLIVTRQIFANGTSKYLLNDQVIKQKTVKQLFQSTGLNINNPNFLIMQGRIQSILNMKPTELLMLLEETAGTLMYDQNKKDAEKTFDSKEMRLNQIRKTISEEIMPKIEQLERERTISVKICQLQKGLRGMEIIGQIRRVLQELGDLDELVRQQRANAEAESQLRAELVQSEQALQRKQADAQQIAVRDVDPAMVRQYDEISNAIALNRQNVDELGRKLRAHDRDVEGWARQAERLRAQNGQCEERLRLDARCARDFAEQSAALEAMRKRQAALERQLDLAKTGTVDWEYVRGIIDADESVAELVRERLLMGAPARPVSLSELAILVSQNAIKDQNYAGQLQLEVQRQTEQVALLSSQQLATQDENIQAQNGLSMNAKKIGMMLNQLAKENGFAGIGLREPQNGDYHGYLKELDAVQARLKREIGSIRQSHSNLAAKMQSVTQRCADQRSALLSDFQNRCGNKIGLQILNMVSTARQQGAQGLPLGLVIDFTEINQAAVAAYAQQHNCSKQAILAAAENFVSSKLFNLIFATVSEASEFVRSPWCKTRCTALPIDNVSALQIQQARINKVHQYGGMLLSEVFTPTDGQLGAIFSQLFGSIVVCENLQVAHQIAYDDECRFKCVTLDQDVVDPSGVVSGGRRHTQQEFLSYYCQLRGINTKKEVESIETQLNAVGEQLLRLSNCYQSICGLQQQISVTVDQLSRSKYFQLARQISRLKEEINDNQHKLGILTALTQQYSAISQRISTSKEAIDQIQLGKQLAEVNRDVEQQQRVVDAIKNSSSFKSISDVQLQIKATEDEIAQIMSQIEQKKAEAAQAQMLLQEYIQRGEQYQAQFESISQTIQQQDNNKQEQLLQQARLVKEIDQLTAQLAKKQARFKQIIAENRDGQSAFNSRNNTIRELVETSSEYLSIIHEIDADRYQQIIQNYKFKKSNQLGIKYLVQYLFDSNLIEAQHTDDVNAMREIVLRVFPQTDKYIQSINQQLRDLQENNKNVTTSTANLEELQKSAKQLTQMEQKLLQDKEKIMDLITRVDQKKQSALEDLFVNVNRNIGSIFGILLPGGTAELNKVNPHDINKGVQFKIKLGETNTTLSGLSGGQKSLLALSFTLALLRYKPSPIYILDEIDAALDLSHTHGIGRLIQQEFKGSQFIIVSLKEGMFNHANQLFRVKFTDGMSRIEAIK